MPQGLPSSYMTAHRLQQRFNPAAMRGAARQSATAQLGATPQGPPAPAQSGSRFWQDLQNPFANIFDPGSAADVAAAALGGPTQQQQDLVAQLTQARFQQGIQGLEEQTKRLSGILGSSAAARGLLGSNTALGQQQLLGEEMLRQVGNLQGQLQTAGLEQLLQLPFQTSQMLGNLGGLDINRQNLFETLRMGRAQRDQAGGGGLGGLFGSLAGSIIPGIGTAVGGLVGGGLENLFTGGGGGYQGRGPGGIGGPMRG